MRDYLITVALMLLLSLLFCLLWAGGAAAIYAIIG